MELRVPTHLSTSQTRAESKHVLQYRGKFVSESVTSRETLFLLKYMTLWFILFVSEVRVYDNNSFLFNHRTEGTTDVKSSIGGSLTTSLLTNNGLFTRVDYDH